MNSKVSKGVKNTGEQQAPTVKFRTTILRGGKTATGIEVPAELVERLGQGKRPPVSVTIKGYTYRSTVAVMGGKFMVGVSAEVRAAAGVEGGDEVDITLTLDGKPREVNVPADLAKALKQHPDAKQFFDKLSYSNKLRHVLSIEDAKTEETRQRRIEKAIELFNAGRS